MPRSRHTLLVAGIVLGGCLLRALFLSHDALWVDEAESAINALTILEHGYPTDHYLGMPIYENTLVRPWPESEEYEFKDISYSRRGMAIYHGWLPLYAIAAALSAAGFAPDQPAETPVATHAAAELTRRTVVPRLPSLAFSAVFLLCLYRLGRELQGRELGLAVLLAAACCEPVVWFGWQARYYAATLAFSAATALWILKLGKDRRLSTAAVLGLLLVLLFHCHSLSFLIMAAVLACSLPRCLAQPRPLLRLGVLGAIVAAGTVPWMIATGFLGEAPAIPMAWTLLGPHDFAAYALRFPTLSLVVGLGLAAPLITRFCSRRLPPQTASALAERQGTLTFASPWLLIALLAFSFLIPAASHFTRRLTLVLVIPGLLLTASMLSTALRVLRGKASPAWTSLATAGLLLALGKLPFSEKQGSFGAEVPHLVAMVNRWPLRPGTKLYATPNDHLVMTYYTGLPFQSIAAVRRSFLDSYPGDVIILEGQSPLLPLSVRHVQAIAASEGTTVDEAGARRRSRRSIEVAVHRAVAPDVREVSPAVPALDRLDEVLAGKVAEVTRQTVRHEWQDLLMVRGLEETTTSFWQAFFYRFSGVASRLGPERNYARRISRGRAIVLPRGLVVYDCRGDGAPPLAAAGDRNDAS